MKPTTFDQALVCLALSASAGAVPIEAAQGVIVPQIELRNNIPVEIPGFRLVHTCGDKTANHVWPSIKSNLTSTEKWTLESPKWCLDIFDLHVLGKSGRIVCRGTETHTFGPPDHNSTTTIALSQSSDGIVYEISSPSDILGPSQGSLTCSNDVPGLLPEGMKGIDNLCGLRFASTLAEDVYDPCQGYQKSL